MASTGFARPTFTTLLERVRDDLNLRIPGSDSRVRRTLTYALAYVFAGLAHGLYGFLAWTAEQLLPDTGDEQTVETWRTLLGLAAITKAKATGSVKFTGTVAATLIPAGTVIVRADGVEYTTDANANLGAAPIEVVVAVTASVAAADGNADAGTLLDLASPIAGVTTTATVESGGLTGGLDDEGVEAKRVRVLERMAETPQGGASSDYVAWAKTVATVDEVWPVGNSPQPGDVTVRFSVVQDGAPSTVTPGAGVVSAVQTAIDAERPITAIVTVVAPVGNPVPLTIHLGTDTADIRTAVEGSLDAMFARSTVPGGTIRNSVIREAISAATGETWHTLSDVDGLGGLGDVVNASNEVAYRGTITWV